MRGRTKVKGDVILKVLKCGLPLTVVTIIELVPIHLGIIIECRRSTASGKIRYLFHYLLAPNDRFYQKLASLIQIAGYEAVNQFSPPVSHDKKTGKKNWKADKKLLAILREWGGKKGKLTLWSIRLSAMLCHWQRHIYYFCWNPRKKTNISLLEHCLERYTCKSNAWCCVEVSTTVEIKRLFFRREVMQVLFFLF